MESPESTRNSTIRYSGVNLCRTQPRMAEQLLKGANVNPALQHVRGKAMTQHMRIHHPQLGSPSDLLHDSP
jgi:hypothetical protein